MHLFALLPRLDNAGLNKKINTYNVLLSKEWRDRCAAGESGDMEFHPPCIPADKKFCQGDSLTGPGVAKFTKYILSIFAEDELASDVE